MNLSEICSYKNKIILILEHFFATFVRSNLLDDYLVQLICLTFCVKVLPNCSFIVNLDFSSICFRYVLKIVNEYIPSIKMLISPDC